MCEATQEEARPQSFILFPWRLCSVNLNKIQVASDCQLMSNSAPRGPSAY